MVILQDENRNSNAIAWHYDGTQFSIRDRDLLCMKVLPRYFGDKNSFKYDAFAKRLRRWKFKRTTKGINTRIYNHPVSFRIY